MLNQEVFVKRLHTIFEHYNLTAAMFADEIKVQRSSISHLLSGRNKPSLEFVLKITNHYKEVSFDWLLNGKGSFPKTEEVKSEPNLFNPTPSSISEKKTGINTIESVENIKQQNTTIQSTDVEKIVVFYKDGTFKEYLQR